MARDLTDTVIMGPLLSWPKEQGPSPVCKGNCIGGGRFGWTQRNGMSYCGGCNKPSQGFLKLCEICETVYVYEPWNLSAYRIQDFNPTMPRVLPHSACARALEEMTND